MLAIITLFTVIGVSLIIMKVATISLVHTGLSVELAKFQVRSAYTGTGFTSNETEELMHHPVRRKIIYSLMLIGNLGVVTTMSSLVLTFVRPNEEGSLWYSIIAIIIGILLLYLAIRSKTFNRWLSNIIKIALSKYTSIDVKDYVSIMRLTEDYQISELHVTDDSWLAGKTLIELKLRNNERVTILGIEREDGTYIGSPNGTSRIEVGDTLTIYSKSETFENLANHKVGDSAKTTN